MRRGDTKRGRLAGALATGPVEEKPPSRLGAASGLPPGVIEQVRRDIRH